MEEMKRDKTRRRHIFVKYIGIVTLSLLMLVSMAGAAPFAYIPNDYSNSVSVIDTTTDTVTASITVGSSPFGVACLPNGTKVYVTNLDGDSVSVIDTATNTVTDTINVGDQPRGIVVSPDGNKAYVANYDGSSVSVIDLGTKQVVATIKVGTSPFGISITPDGSKVYVANYYGASVSVINTATNRVTSTISTNGFKPTRVACNPNGNAVYVTCSARVMVIDPATNQIVKNIGTGGTPIGVAVNSNGTKVYVTNSNNDGSGSVIVIDPVTYNIVSRVTVDKIPWGISLTPDDSKIYTTSIDSNRATVINATTNTVIGHIQTGSYPAALGQFITDVPVIPPVFPIADSSSNVTQGYAPLSVQFIDLSTNATSVKWDFGDGNNSTERNPVHEYSDPGTYPVNLTASNENGTDSKSATITVLEQPILPVAIFSAKPTSGKAPLNVVFTDESTGAPTSWKWTFGDRAKSSVQNPTHKYSKVGSYTVTLTATNAEGNNTVTKTDYIKVIEKPVAKFTSNVTSGKAPLTVAFTDKSKGILTSWKWTFGDGAKSSVQNPIHQYSQEGKYKVTLTVTNAAGSSITTKTNYIKVKTNTRPGIYSSK